MGDIVFVAQISNLLYRRLPVGKASGFRTGAGMGSNSRRLETCDTADWKSALQGSVAHPTVPSVKPHWQSLPF